MNLQLLLLLNSLDFIFSQQILALNIENGMYKNGIPLIYSQSNVTIRLIGLNLNGNGTRIALAAVQHDYGVRCDDDKESNAFYLFNATENIAFATVIMDVVQDELYYLCLKSNDSSFYIHQSSSHWLTIKISPQPERNTLLPFVVQIFVIIILVLLSGIFSGLNLGLMSLDPLELQILVKSGTKNEQHYASLIYPVRKHGNFLLCTLLLGNVLVNNTMTILLGDITTGTIAIVGATAAIVTFGEITPQALCSRYGLWIGAHTIWLTKFFMVLTFILSYPISYFLDFLLGKEIGTVYNRKKLLEMLKVTEPFNDLAKSEVNIIQGALELRLKKVEDVMTPIESCFMVDVDSFLDFETMSKIMSTGFTRIPVYNKVKTDLVSVLFVKDLAFVDPDDCMPLRTVCKFYQHPLHYVLNNITLDKLLEKFKGGAFHMAIVQRRVSNTNVDDSFEMVGIITLEDVIEEIIKAEIVDETDVYIDNRRRALNPARQTVPLDLSLFIENSKDIRRLKISPQILLAAHRFLLAEVEPFRSLSSKILLTLLKRDVVVLINYNLLEPDDEKLYIYHKNVPTDYFVLILEGIVKVFVGKESLEFQGGPFSFYGVSALKVSTLNQVDSAAPSRTRSRSQSDSGAVESSSSTGLSSVLFYPDFDLIAASDVKYVKITRKNYISALNATKMSEEGKPDSAIKESGAALTRNPNRDSMSTSSNAVNNQSYYDVKMSSKDEAVRQEQISSDQLMSIAAHYATVAGDRFRPATLIRSTSNSDRSFRPRAPDNASVDKKKRKH